MINDTLHFIYLFFLIVILQNAFFLCLAKNGRGLQHNLPAPTVKYQVESAMLRGCFAASGAVSLDLAQSSMKNQVENLKDGEQKSTHHLNIGITTPKHTWR